VYVARTEFGRRKIVEGDLPSDRIAFAYPDPGHGTGDAVFVGRLPAVPSWSGHDVSLAGAAFMGYPHCNPFDRPWSGAHSGKFWAGLWAVR
jgi:hypothetical protein